MVGQDKSIRTKLLKPQKFGRDKDRADATTYKADQNDGVGLYYVMVNLYRDISQSHKRTLEAAINAASTKFRSGSPTAPLQDLQSQVQEALDLKVRIKWDQSAIPLMGMLTRRNPLFTEVTKKYSENPPDDPEDSAVELDDLCTDVQLMIERLDRDGETWDRSSGSARKVQSRVSLCSRNAVEHLTKACVHVLTQILTESHSYLGIVVHSATESTEAAIKRKSSS